jgi:thioredoxin reductase (NADPH)
MKSHAGPRPERAAYDCVIIGAGMAGLTAGLWSHRLGLRSVILERSGNPGGQLHWIQGNLTDFPGFSGTGGQLAEKICSQLDPHSAEICTEVDVTRIATEQEVRDDLFSLETSGGIVRGHAVLLAAGLRPRLLKSLQAYEGRGVVYTSRPREMFRGHHLVIVGGGDGAVENAVLLAEQWKQITIVYRGERLRAQTGLLERMRGCKNVEVMLESEVQKGFGKESLEGVVVAGPAGTKEIVAQSVLVKIGFEVQSDLLASGQRRYTHPGCVLRANDEQIALHDTGEIPLDSRPVWVAGDVSTHGDPSLVVAAGQACIAMRSIERHLREVIRR